MMVDDRLGDDYIRLWFQWFDVRRCEFYVGLCLQYTVIIHRKSTKKCPPLERIKDKRLHQAERTIRYDCCIQTIYNVFRITYLTAIILLSLTTQTNRKPVRNAKIPRQIQITLQ